MRKDSQKILTVTLMNVLAVLDKKRNEVDTNTVNSLFVHLIKRKVYLLHLK